MNKKELTCYNTDASRLIGDAEKVVFPKTPEAVQKIVKTSNLDIVPRGAGTGLVGGAIPDNSIVVDMSKMDKVSDFDIKKMTVKVEAGITINELNERLSRVSFEFPFQTNNQGISSIGGMIALNHIGNKSVKYGVIKDWIEEIEFVNGRGELMKTSKSDLGDICGMEGITGIIVSAVLKIIPQIKRSASLFQSDDLEEIFSIAKRLKLEKELSSLDLFPPQVSKLLGLPEKYHLIIEFDSDRGKIKGEEYKILSKFNDRVYYVLASEGYYDSDDPKFFFDKLIDFMEFLETNNVPYFSKLGAGVIYPFFKDEEKNKKAGVLKMISRMGGKPGEYGIGLKRKHIKENSEKKILHRIKMRHDPFGKINKNKIIDADFESGPMRKEKPKSEYMEQLEKLEQPDVHHLKPIGDEELEEIKPFIKEEPSEFIEELKTPEERMGEFIEKVELIDKSKEQEIDKPENKLNFEISSNLKDYESTYKSELEDRKKREIEDFAKSVAHDIIHPKPFVDVSDSVQKDSSEEQGQSEKSDIDKEKPEEKKQPQKEFKIDDPNVEKRGKLSKEEEDEINKLMFGS